MGKIEAIFREQFITNVFGTHKIQITILYIFEYAQFNIPIFFLIDLKIFYYLFNRIFNDC